MYEFSPRRTKQCYKDKLLFKFGYHKAFCSGLPAKGHVYLKTKIYLLPDFIDFSYQSFDIIRVAQLSE